MTKDAKTLEILTKLEKVCGKVCQKLRKFAKSLVSMLNAEEV